MEFRLLSLRLLVIIVVVIMSARLYHLQMVTGDSNRFGVDPEVITRRNVVVAPRRGEIFAADAQTLLAESVPVYSLAVVPGRMPDANRQPWERAEVVARLGKVAELSSTLILTPTMVLEERPLLRRTLNDLGPLPPITSSEPLTLTIAPQHSLRALELTRTYSDVLRLESPIEAMIARQSVRPYQPVLVAEALSNNLAMAISENSNYLPGAQVIASYQRRYPHSAEVPSLSHLLGYIGRINECELLVANPASSWLTSMADVVGQSGRCGLLRKPIDPASLGLAPYQVDDRIGKDGLEASYERELRGHLGLDMVFVDALNRPVSAMERVYPVENGLNLVLSIDIPFQAEVERLLRDWIAEGEARRQRAPEAYKRDYDPIVAGSAVALDPRDGRILAMVSLPAFDNNVWVDPRRQAELIALLSPSDPEELAELLRLAPLTNRSITGQYPPGSTLKQFVGAAALQQGIITADTQLRDPGVLRLIERGGALFELPNSIRERDNGLLNLADALRLSSNVFFASIAGGNDQATNLDDRALRITGMQIEGLVEGLDWFHFGRTTGVDIAGEAPGLLPTSTWKAAVKREVWTTGDTYNTAIGQGDLLVTPLQLAVAAGGIALDGTIQRPHVVTHLTDSNGATVRTIAPEVISRVPVDPAHLQAIRHGMRESVMNVPNRTAHPDCAGLDLAGKTGTAEFGPLILRPNQRLVRQSHAWFVGFAPYDNPEIVVAVLIEGVGDLGDGSSTMALPAVTQIMQAYYQIAPPADAPANCPVLPVRSPVERVEDVEEMEE
ncbi:penicillin-binding transpeptidase domain-containing protein [Candidatus Viridilinea mediisalina]|uniref:Peptidoglycan glycosyltransferase n=1 Tax=Candidatus Viridilinea mediisalina TaxID=2024553 RepID=A0A2A6RPM0_9CHLR|nr:penicillin-binding transpeptidase domain-containing protein [Candidatus Viridilinea mediisalina]PDW04876.1 peptidoglycan glycosyltransferase [Candidatus Viridilinea mediisalina]